jgi:hypothetical protein
MVSGASTCLARTLPSEERGGEGRRGEEWGGEGKRLRRSGPGVYAESLLRDVLRPDLEALHVRQVAQCLVDGEGELLFGDGLHVAARLGPDERMVVLGLVVAVDGDPRLEPQRPPTAIGKRAGPRIALEALA